MGPSGGRAKLNDLQEKSPEEVRPDYLMGNGAQKIDMDKHRIATGNVL